MTRPRPDPLARPRELAFAGRLRESARALDRTSRDGDALEVRWIRSYLAAARGHFARAEHDARAVLRSAVDPSLRARVAVTLGSILRQTGRHAEAHDVESATLRRTSTPAHRAHLLVGLAADAVGLGDLRTVDRRLEQAGSFRVRDPRLTIRLRWVRCERELLAGRPERAARWARAAVAASRRAGARRHLAKSLLFLGASQLEVVRRAEGAPSGRAAAEARWSLHEARATAERIGAGPIARVAGELLGRPAAGR